MIIKDVFSKCYNKERYKYLYDLIKDFSFNHAVIKGDVLSMQAYNKCNQRYYTDIDILLSIDDLPKAQKGLLSHGYKCMCHNRTDRILIISSSHQLPSYSLDLPSPWQPLIVDINHDIFWGEYEGRRIDMKTFLEDTTDMIVQDVSIKVLTPIKAMIQLVLHHYKDMNSIYLLSKCNSINNRMFADLYNLLMNNLNTITLENLYNTSLKYNVILYKPIV